MLSQKVVGVLCFTFFVFHSIYLFYTNSNQQSVDNSKYVELSTINFPLKIEVTVDPGKLSYLCVKCIKNLSFKGFNLTKLNEEGFEGGIWDLFFAPNQDLVEIFRQDNISGKARFV